MSVLPGAAFALSLRCRRLGQTAALSWRDRTGLVHFAVPLVLGEHPLGALVAGQVFDHYAEQLPLEQVARQLGLSPAPAWQAARLEHPVKRATLEVYADLLATLGQTFLQTRYHTIMAAERRGQERTAEANEARARLLKQVMSAREEEQRRIARDLHDGIGQSLTSLLLGLRAAAEVPTFEEARARLGELRGITASLLDEVRRLARGLRRAFWTIWALRQPWSATRPITPKRTASRSMCTPRTWPWPVCRQKWRRLCTASPRRRSRMS